MRRFLLVLGLCLTYTGIAVPAEPTLTKEEIKEFLLNAKVISSRQTRKGITNPWRLTLSDGKITHDAVFQSVDQRRTSMQLADGRTEINFVDSYKYNIAAYALAELLGMDDLIPVHVERRWNGNRGSLSWLVPVQMDEGERLQRKLSSPDIDAWNKQMYKHRVFNELVYDTDPNLTNFLIGDNWKIWRVDYSRAFRLNKDLKNVKNLVLCERQLFEKLKLLNETEVRQKTKDFLTELEVEGLMARRDKIVEFFQKQIAEKGEAAVLY